MDTPLLLIALVTTWAVVMFLLAYEHYRSTVRENPGARRPAQTKWAFITFATILSATGMILVAT